MSKSKHTPGPWYWTEGELSWQLFAKQEGHPIQLIKAPKRSVEFAEYWPNRADADLIAAAPDMLEFLERLEIDDGNIPDAIWQMRNAAIAKAKGK
jgi:hypothetical protein